MAGIFDLNTYAPAASYLNKEQRQNASDNGLTSMALQFLSNIGTGRNTFQSLASGIGAFGSGANNYAADLAKYYQPYQDMKYDAQLNDYMSANPNAAEQMGLPKGMPITPDMLKSMASSKAAMNLAMFYQPQLAAAKAKAELPINMELAKLKQQMDMEQNGVAVRDENTGSDVIVPKASNESILAYGFAKRMGDAEDVLKDEQGQGASLSQRITDAMPLVGNYAVSGDYQKFKQARDNFINAQLRRESGAAISKDEYIKADKQYFPLPGDDQATIDQKRANRLSALEAMRVSSGPYAKTIKRRDQAQSNDYTDEDLKHTADKYGMTVDDVKKQLGIK